MFLNRFFRYRQLNNQTVLFETIRTNNLFRISLNITQLYLTTNWTLHGATNPVQSETGNDGEVGFSAFPKAPSLLEFHIRNAVGSFFRPSRLYFIRYG